MNFFKMVISILLSVSLVSSRPQSTFSNDIGTNIGDIFEPPHYAYSYKVASDEESTYISHNESRDGNFVTGEYSFVDPHGSLVIVNYIADEQGYREQRSIQENFLTPVRHGLSKEPTSASVSPTTTTVPPIQSEDQLQKNLVASLLSQLVPFIEEVVSQRIRDDARNREESQLTILNERTDENLLSRPQLQPQFINPAISNTDVTDLQFLIDLIQK